jgi:ribosomal protein L11 methyltransferase
MGAWLQVRLTSATVDKKRLSSLLVELGAGGVEERPADGGDWPVVQPWETATPQDVQRVELTAWLPLEAEGAAENALTEAGATDVSLAQVQDEDWEANWKQHHKPVRISTNLRVSPPWEAVPGDLVIEPGNAFGTGEHPATRSCLEAVESLAPGLGTCLDVGCGSGVLALAARRHGLEVRGIDIDPAAVTEAQRNADRNALQVCIDGTDLSAVSGSWDLVVANLYAEVICELAEDLARVTGKHLVLAGILSDRWESVLEALSPPLTLASKTDDGEWVSLRMVRP